MPPGHLDIFQILLDNLSKIDLRGLRLFLPRQRVWLGIQSLPAEIAIFSLGVLELNAVLLIEFLSLEIEVRFFMGGRFRVHLVLFHLI